MFEVNYWLSTVDDYIYRPYELSDQSLYEWIQIYKRWSAPKQTEKIQSPNIRCEPTSCLQSDEEVDTDFDSDQIT